MICLGSKVVRNPAAWRPGEFDTWGAGDGLGVVVEPPWAHRDGIFAGEDEVPCVDVRWPLGRAFQRVDELLPAEYPGLGGLDADQLRTVLAQAVATIRVQAEDLARARADRRDLLGLFVAPDEDADRWAAMNDVPIFSIGGAAHAWFPGRLEAEAAVMQAVRSRLQD